MIHEFEAWSASRSETNSFADLDGAVIAINASFYLNHLLTTPPSKEPLLSALGGLPFALKAHIEKELKILQDANITPIFVFDGLQTAQQYDPFQQSLVVRSLVNEAWDLYNQHLAERAVNAFGNSGYAKPGDYYSLLISVLYKWGVQFQVAPSSACAQLVYLASLDSKYCDAIAGPSELLLFDVDKVITRLDFELAEFTFVQKKHCMEELGVPSSDMFIDACMLTGSDFLPHLPTLNGTNNRQHRIRDVLSLMRARGETGNSTCVSLSDTEPMKRFNYLNRYRRAKLAVKHYVFFTETGKAEVFDLDNAPFDIALAIGVRLPDEVYYYISKGAIGRHFLSEFSANSFNDACPVDGGDSELYRDLVRDKLTPILTTSVCLLARTLSRYFQNGVTYVHKCWFDPDTEYKFRVNELPDPHELVNDWNVKEDVITTRSELKTPGIRVLLQALNNDAFAKKTVTLKDDASPLSTKLEILTNVQWRFLRLRDYINAEHKLTPWGKVLEAVSKQMADSPFEDAPIILVELLRYNMLDSDASLIPYNGAPIRGSDTDKRNCLLASRLACLGKLKHKAIGFTGPLSRHLLAFNSIICRIRASLRDLLEMCFLTLLLRGDADREHLDFTDISLSLPFYFQNDCSLGIAMKQYLDELAAYEDSDSPTEQLKAGVKERGPKEWFAHAEDFQGDLARGFEIWDALLAGVRCAAGLNLVKTPEKWEEVDKWVKERR